jgi:hypothetical protein
VGSVLRGVINPALDYLATKSPQLQTELRDADALVVEADGTDALRAGGEAVGAEAPGPLGAEAAGADAPGGTTFG